MLIYALIGTINAYADVDPETPWPVEQRCVPDPIQPPEDWTFEGTIIATGWAGIHGMNAAWDTPQVLAFKDGWITQGGFGTLSPNGRWYAVPQAIFTSEPGNLYGGYAEVTQLLFYDLKEAQVLRKEWNESYNLFFGSSSSRYYTFRMPVWFDNETVIYQRGETYYSIRLPDLLVEEWPDPAQWHNDRWNGISPVWTFISHPAPDWSRIVIRTTGDMELFNTETNEFITVVYDPTANIDLPGVAWHPDSTEFIIAGALSTTLYDANGELLHRISPPREEDTFNNQGIRSNAYSPDGTIFYLLIYGNRQATEQWHLALANSSNQTITDTCIDSRMSAQFSPDGRHMALLSSALGRQELLIFDIENWRLYRTGIYHDGEIIGWRED